jgi:hypothetical protein
MVPTTTAPVNSADDAPDGIAGAAAAPPTTDANPSGNSSKSGDATATATTTTSPPLPSPTSALEIPVVHVDPTTPVAVSAPSNPTDVEDDMFGFGHLESLFDIQVGTLGVTSPKPERSSPGSTTQTDAVGAVGAAGAANAPTNGRKGVAADAGISNSSHSGKQGKGKGAAPTEGYAAASNDGDNTDNVAAAAAAATTNADGTSTSTAVTPGNPNPGGGPAPFVSSVISPPRLQTLGPETDDRFGLDPMGLRARALERQSTIETKLAKAEDCFRRQQLAAELWKIKRRGGCKISSTTEGSASVGCAGAGALVMLDSTSATDADAAEACVPLVAADLRANLINRKRHRGERRSSRQLERHIRHVASEYWLMVLFV